MTNIKSLITENERLRILAEQDSLTGLFNRRTMEERIDLILNGNASGVFIILDLDHFKCVNDSYVHLMGDRLLQEIGRLISCCFFKRDLTGRIGGDEFVVFLAGYYEKKFIREKTENLRSRVRQAGIELGLKRKVSFTAGVSFTEKGDTFEQLYDRADCALRYGKMDGKSKLCFYNPSMNPPIRESTINGRKLFCGSDMKYIVQELKESDKPDGTFFQDYHAFLSVYRFVERLLTRFNLKCHIVLITMMDSAGTFVNLEERGLFMDKLRDSIRVSLRASDICTQYSSCQYLVMVPGARKSNMEYITARIEQEFQNRQIGQTEIILMYSFYPMGEEP